MIDRHLANNYIAVIQAGGLGTRMVEYTKNKIPKPLLMLNGKPMIEWQMDNLADFGITEFVIIIGHLGDKIKEHYGTGDEKGYKITYIEEASPLGSAGGLFYLKDMLQDRNVILVFGDVMFDIEWSRFISFHEEKKADISLLVHPNSHPFDSDLVLLDREDRVTGIDKKDHIRDYWYKNCVNAGLYVLSNTLIKNAFNKAEKMDLEKDIIIPRIHQGKVFGYRTSEYVKDSGTPDRYRQVCEEQKNGVWTKKSLRNKQSCVFLDRDGTINKYNGLVSRDDEFELEEGVTDAIKFVNQSGRLAIVVTNQPVVARGMCQIEDVIRIHDKMETLLGREGAYLDDIVFCPHHPDKGFPEENPLYKVECDCRKPKIGMIKKMAEKFNIDLESSYYVGDSTVDIQTGINAGLHTVLVKTGMAGTDGKYDVRAEYEADNLLEAVNMIVG